VTNLFELYFIITPSAQVFTYSILVNLNLE